MNQHCKRIYTISWPIMCFGLKGKNTTTTTTTKQKIKQKSLQTQGMEHTTFCTSGGCFTSGPTSKLKVLIVIELLNFVDTQIKKGRICGPHVFNIFIYLAVFTNLKLYLEQNKHNKTKQAQMLSAICPASSEICCS